MDPPPTASLDKEFSDTCHRAKATAPQFSKKRKSLVSVGPASSVTLQNLDVLHKKGCIYKANHRIPAQDPAARRNLKLQQLQTQTRSRVLMAR